MSAILNLEMMDTMSVRMSSAQAKSKSFIGLDINQNGHPDDFGTGEVPLKDVSRWRPLVGFYRRCFFASGYVIFFRKKT